MERTAIITARIEPELKKAFEAIAAKNDLTTSQMVRMFIRQTVAEDMARNKQPELDLGGGAKKGKRGERISQAWKQGRD